MVQTELQYKFVYLAVKHYMDTAQRLVEEQVTLTKQVTLTVRNNLYTDTWYLYEDNYDFQFCLYDH